MPGGRGEHCRPCGVKRCPMTEATALGWDLSAVSVARCVTAVSTGKRALRRRCWSLECRCVAAGCTLHTAVQCSAVQRSPVQDSSPRGRSTSINQLLGPDVNGNGSPCCHGRDLQSRRTTEHLLACCFSLSISPPFIHCTIRPRLIWRRVPPAREYPGPVYRIFHRRRPLTGPSTKGEPDESTKGRIFLSWTRGPARQTIASSGAHVAAPASNLERKVTRPRPRSHWALANPEVFDCLGAGAPPPSRRITSAPLPGSVGGHLH